MGFRINLEYLRQELLKKNEGELKALVTLHYPIICVHAEIVDSTPDALDKVDRLILSFSLEIESCTHDTVHVLSGLERKVIRDRIRALSDSGLVKVTSKSIIQITEEGKHFLSTNNAVLDRFRNVDFYFDGVNLLPLKREFVRRYGEHFVSESDGFHVENNKADEDSEELKWISSFRPDIIHQTLTLGDVKQVISKIDEERREEFGIPSGLKEVVKYSFTNLTFPVLVALSDNEGVAVKKLVNGMDFYGKTELMGNFKVGLETRIKGLQVKLQQTKNMSYKLGSNWDIIDKYQEDYDRLFNIPNEDLRVYLEEQFGLNQIDINRAISNERSNMLNIVKEDIKRTADPKGLIEHLVRGRHTIYGNPQNSSVYQFWINIEPADSYTRRLKELVTSIRNVGDNIEEKTNAVLSVIEENDLEVREMLILSGNRRILEEIDMRKYIAV